MKKYRLAVAGAALAGVVALKVLLPELSAEVRERTLGALAQDTDYRAVFERLGSWSASASLKNPSSETGRTAENEVRGETARPAQVTALVRYRVEEAVSLGETVPEPELPEAVAVFLESQAAFADQALPANVDYAYEDFPFPYTLPVNGYSSSGFGFRIHPILNEIKFHYGTDVAALSGEDILAFADGTVTFAGYSDSYGNYITVDHGDGWTSLYAHCSYLYVQTGQKIKAGEKIALVGATGLATGPHLHFELQHDGVYLNPEYYINSIAG